MATTHNVSNTAGLLTALAVAVDGDTIIMANGTYTLSSTLHVGHDITLTGASQAGVVLNYAPTTGYGILLDANGATLSNFTLNGAGGNASGNYGIKAQPDSGVPTDRLFGITLENLTVSNFGRSEVDLNGVEFALIKNVTANGMGTAGNGIALTDSSNVTLTDIATTGNGWGSVALYTTNNFYDNQTANVAFTGTYSASETVKIYAQDESATTDLGAVTFPPSYTGDGDGTFTVTNNQFRADGQTFKFFFANLSDAQALAQSLAFPSQSVIRASDGNFFVAPGMSIQAAIDAASDGNTIFIAPGTYTEQTTYQGGSEIGLVIHKSVTLQGITAGGALINDVSQVAAHIVSGAQSWWGTNFFVTAANVTVNGLDFVAADGTLYNQGNEVNKAFEVVADNFTLSHSRVGAADGIEVASTVYINDDMVPSNLTGWQSDIASYHIQDNILEGSFVTTNGPGYGVSPASIHMVVSNNQFVMNAGSDPGYNFGILVTGKESGIPWRLAPAVLPQVTGNSFSSDYALIFRGADDNAANLPDRAYIDAFLAANTILRYAFATQSNGQLRLVDFHLDNPYGAGDVDSKRVYVDADAETASARASAGDTLIVHSGATTENATIMVDDLHVQATAGSADLNLTLGIGVTGLALGDYATGLGANVDVVGNGLANTILGNSGNNALSGAGGDDTLSGGDGNDTVIGGADNDHMSGGAGQDTAVFNVTFASALISIAGDDVVIDSAEGHDNLTGFEIFQFIDGAYRFNGDHTALVSVNSPQPPVATPAPKPPVNDFNGDGHGDILWQNADGTPAVWLVDGFDVKSGANVGFNPGAAWHVIGSGDFNGDGKADILWQNNDGTVAEWFLDGTSLTSGGSVDFNPGAAWHAIGTGDFNGDGKADILWQNSNGQAAAWLMDGLSIVAGTNVGSNMGAAWHTIGTGDFNGDGKSDILWQHDNGTAAVWLMDGTSILSGANIGSSPGSAWNVQAAGDFDGDGKADILWQNDNGQAAVWLMDGTTLRAGANVGPNFGPSWQIHSAADFNDDGKADIEWQNTDGTPAVWLMDGFNLLAGGNVAFNPGAAWHVVPPHHDLV